MPNCNPGYVEDASGNCIIDPNAGATGQITCYDGSLADSYDKCPDIGTEWETAAGTIGIDPDTGELGQDVFGENWVAPAWWDDPSTEGGMEEDEWAQYIYQKSGGQETTGLDFLTFWDQYGADYPTWEESGYAAKYENVLSQLGMLNTSIRLANEEFNLDLDSLSTRTQAHMETALTQKEDIGRQMESQFIGTGGVVSGRSVQAAKDTSENIDQALTLEFRGIDIEKDLLQITYEGELVNIEDRKLDYENELIGIEDSYEKHLIDLITLYDIEKVDCGDQVSCADGSCADTYENCPEQKEYACEFFGDCDDDGDGDGDDECAGCSSTTSITASGDDRVVSTCEDKNGVACPATCCGGGSYEDLDEEKINCSCVDGEVRCTVTYANSTQTFVGQDATDFFDAYGQSSKMPTCGELTECSGPSDCPPCDDPNDRAQCVNNKCECLSAGMT